MEIGRKEIEKAKEFNARIQPGNASGSEAASSGPRFNKGEIRHGVGRVLKDNKGVRFD